jgi:hypothetical protein
MRYSLPALMLACALATPALAEEMIFTCPTEGQLMFRDAGSKNIIIAVDGDAMKLDGPFGTASLSAQVEEREGMIGIRAAGDATVPMPDKAAVDACIDQQKSKQPEAFEDGRNEYLELGCKSEAKVTEPVPVRMNVELVVIEKPEAMLTMTRRYAEEEGTAAELHGVDMIGSCKMGAP